VRKFLGAGGRDERIINFKLLTRVMLNRGVPGGLVTGSFGPLAGGKKQSTGGKINPQETKSIQGWQSCHIAELLSTVHRLLWLK